MIIPTAYAESEVNNQSDNQNPTSFAGETVNLGPFNLPASKSVMIVFQATVADPNGATQMTTQGSVSGTNFGTVMTDDPAVGGANDPTVTPLALSPTAADATVSGRVISPSGRGLGGVRVTIIGGDMTEPRYTQTNPFGYYRFTELQAGNTFVITVSAKRYEFSNPTRVVNLSEDITNADFISNK